MAYDSESSYSRPSPLQSASTEFYRSLGSVFCLAYAKITNLFPQQSCHSADPGASNILLQSSSFLPSEFHTAAPARHSCQLRRPAATPSVTQWTFLFSATGLDLRSRLSQLHPCPPFLLPKTLKLSDLLYNVQQQKAIVIFYLCFNE